MLNTLKILSLNYLSDIAIYDYKSNLMYTNNKNIKQCLNYMLNNKASFYYYYVFIIDYNNKQLNIDIYNNNKKTIFYNINYDLYYYKNNDLFKSLTDFILNNIKNYKVIEINK